MPDHEIDPILNSDPPRWFDTDGYLIQIDTIPFAFANSLDDVERFIVEIIRPVGDWFNFSKLKVDLLESDTAAVMHGPISIHKIDIVSFN